MSNDRDYNGVICRVAGCPYQATKLFDFHCVNHVDKQHNEHFLENDRKVGKHGRNQDGNTFANHFHSGLFMIIPGKLSAKTQAQRILQVEEFFGLSGECPFIVIEMKRGHWPMYRGEATGDIGMSYVFRRDVNHKFIVIDPTNQKEVDFVVSLCFEIENQYCEGICFRDKQGMCPTWLAAYQSASVRLDTPQRRRAIGRHNNFFHSPHSKGLQYCYWNERGEARRHSLQYKNKKDHERYLKREREEDELEEVDAAAFKAWGCSIQ